MRLGDRLGWAMTVGVGILAAIGAGMAVAQDVVQQMNPFYFNASAGDGARTADPEIVDASFTGQDSSTPRTTDLSYGRGSALDDDSADAMR